MGWVRLREREHQRPNWKTNGSRRYPFAQLSFSWEILGCFSEILCCFFFKWRGGWGSELRPPCSRIINHCHKQLSLVMTLPIPFDTRSWRTSQLPLYSFTIEAPATRCVCRLCVAKCCRRTLVSSSPAAHSKRLESSVVRSTPPAADPGFYEEVAKSSYGRRNNPAILCAIGPHQSFPECHRSFCQRWRRLGCGATQSARIMVSNQTHPVHPWYRIWG